MTTRERLLEAAVEEFAGRGYHETTVAAICRRAKANIAAVNYHFGGKKKLYQEAWRYAHRSMVEAFPPDGGVPETAAAAERLRGRIHALLQRALSEKAGQEFRIMDHEMAQPTGLLSQVIHDNLRPLKEAMDAIVFELLGCEVDEHTLHLCVGSVIGPCMHLVRRPRPERHKGMGPALDAAALPSIVDHFTTFALAGLREVRRQIEAGERPVAARARRMS
jgi:AcrR family transcriptional regulator